MAGTLFPVKHSPLLNRVLEVLKFHFGTNVQVGRWRHPINDLRHCTLEDRQLHGKKALARVQSRLDRCTRFFRERERGLCRISGTIVNLADGWKR